jgi:hypothetical protein
MRLTLLAVLFAAGLAFAAGRATEPPPARPNAVPPPEVLNPPPPYFRMAEEAVRRLKADGVAGLCEVVFAEGKSINPPGDRAMATANFGRLRDALLARYGKSTGEFEHLRTESVGTAVVKVTYLEKLERTPAVWRFVFYRVNGEWKWKDIGLSDSLEGEFRAVP